MGNPAGPLTRGFGWPAPNLEEAIPPGLESLPTPPAKGVGDDRAATRAMRLATRYVYMAQLGHPIEIGIPIMVLPSLQLIE